MVKLKIFLRIAVCLAVAQTVCSEDESNIARGIQKLTNQSCGRLRLTLVKPTELPLMSRPSMARLYYTPKDSPQDQVRSSQPHCTGTLIHKRELILIIYIIVAIYRIPNTLYSTYASY